jgi:hypothetical protein
LNSLLDADTEVGPPIQSDNFVDPSQPVIDSALFSAVVIMVIVTTLVTPLALKRSFSRSGAGP